MAKVKVTEAAKPKAIAAQYGIGTKEFRELNKLDKGETVKAGTTVRLGKGVGPVQPSRQAESLYVDPTPAFQPAMDFINRQMGAANQRYATNQADIKSIFGNLSTVRAQDKIKIQDQFTKSITDQQMALAGRTAEARAGSEAGAQQLAVTAGERGEGPMPTSTPVQRAAEEGIARSNEYQQTWEALQNVMSQQAQNDVDAAVRGYDYQQASALEQLRNNLEQRLAGLEGQQVDVQTQLAGAQLQGRQNVMQANYGEIQQRQAQAAALREAQSRAAGTIEAARIRAESEAAERANEPKTYSNDIYGWESKVADSLGAGASSAIRSDIAAIVEDYRANDIEERMPSPAAIMQMWNKLNPRDPAATFVQEYVTRTYGR
jgi:hypothetical protein